MKQCPYRFNLPEPDCIKEKCASFVPAHTGQVMDTKFQRGLYFPVPEYKDIPVPDHCKLLGKDIKD